MLRSATAVQVEALAARPGARATLVNLWATWCVPCRKELPSLLAVARAHRADSLRLVLVSTDFPDQQSDVVNFLRQLGVSDTTYLKAGADMEFINTLNPGWTGALPATLIYDRFGHRVDFWEGEADSARFDSAVARALGIKS